MTPTPETTQIETPTPKKRDPRALNAYRHGLTGQIQIFTPAEQVAYDNHCQTIVKALGPGDAFENSLAQSYADGQWRLNCAVAYEAAAMVDGLDKTPNCHQHPQLDVAIAKGRVWIEKGNNFALNSLYERRIQRNMDTKLKQLRESQAARQAALEKAAYEANLLAQLAKSKGENFNIERDYPREAIPSQFVFSTSEIACLARHIALLEEAKKRFPALKKAA